MHFIPLSSLVVPDNRQRREFPQKHIEDLAESIRTKGLLHPPVVRFAEGKPVLVAGECRSRALRLLVEQGHPIHCNGEVFEGGVIPVTHIRDLDALSIKEAELEENTRRKDLSFQEYSLAVAELHQLRQTQANARGDVQTFRDTAAEILGKDVGTDGLGAMPAKVAQAVTIAKHLHDPDVAKAKTEKEALKIIEKKARLAHNAVLAEQFTASASSECPHTLIEGDMRDAILGLPSGKYTVLLTDPPYGIDADSFGDQSSTGHNYADSEEYFNDLIDVLAVESYRVCAERAHAYVFCDPRRFNTIEASFVLAGWEVWPTPLIWAKNTGMLPRPEHGPRRNYECILYAIKGGKKVHMVKGDVITVPSVRDLDHGAQKPEDLYLDLLSRSAAPGDEILDTFAGSGTIFRAANRAKCRATGIELGSDNANLCRLAMAGEPEAANDDGDADLAAIDSLLN